MSSIDLILAALMMSGVCVVSAILGAQLTRCLQSKSVQVVQVIAVGLFAGYLLFIWDRPILAVLLPFSSVIVLGNWLPLWACFFVGIYFATSTQVKTRQVILAVLAICLSAVSVVSPILGEAPKCRSEDDSFEFQYQTSPYTCSAACATTLLRLHGIDAEEGEIADLCLTRQGAHWMGVYRALKLKTARTNWDVVVETLDVDEKPELSDSPGLLALNFDLTAFPEGLDHGFNTVTGHSVVSLGTGGLGYVDVFDPSPDYGFEKWGDAIWQATTEGVYLRLVPKQAGSDPVAEVRERTRLAREYHHLVLR